MPDQPPELDQGVAATPPGLRPFGAEPATQSQAEPLVPNAVLAEAHSEMEAEFNRAAGTEGWRVVDLPRMALQFFDELLARFGVGQAKMVAGSSGNFRIVNGKSESTENWVRATLLVSPLGMQNLRDSRASEIEARRAETGTGSVHESPVGEAETPNPSSRSSR